MDGGRRTEEDGKWKIGQCSGRPETATKDALGGKYERDLQVQNMQLNAVRKTPKRKYKI